LVLLIDRDRPIDHPIDRDRPIDHPIDRDGSI
jgi:hypothetical protein